MAKPGWSRRGVESETFGGAFGMCVITEPKSRTYGAPPDFLWTLAALANFMRLSLQKAAHAVLDGATYRKSGSGSSSIDAPALPALG
jgi:penicillin V acylase-like amidase (Ntn superfamily)